MPPSTPATIGWSGLRILAAAILTTLVAALMVLPAPSAAEPAPSLVISEFRVRGPNGANDEFVEITNVSGVAHTVSASSGSGYALAASDGTVRFIIPDGTEIAPGGSYLGVNSVGYSLGAGVTGDATYTTDIPDNAGIALFDNDTGGGSFTLSARLDAIGSTSEADTLYKEGSGYTAITPFSIDYSFYRDLRTDDGLPQDTDDNAADLVFVDSNGTSAGAGQRLGAPGPSNMSSPVNLAASLPISPLDECAPDGEAPNQVRDDTSVPANNATFGTVDVRRVITNNTGAPLTALRLRIVDITTFPSPSGTADLRPYTSSDVVVTVDRTPCESGTTDVTVAGTTLEAPPSQPNGGGFNSTLAVPGVTGGTPLANGDSIEVRVLLGVQQEGAIRLDMIPEGIAGGNGSAGESTCVEGNTETTTTIPCDTPVVSGVSSSSADGTYKIGDVIAVTVTFSTSVTVTGTPQLTLETGATDRVVDYTSGSGSTTLTFSYTVQEGDSSADLDHASTAALSLNGGTIRNADDVDADLTLPTPGASGSLGANKAIVVDGTAPTVTVEQAGAQDDPATAGPFTFDVTFSEPVTGFGDADADVVLGGTAGATDHTVDGMGSSYTVTVPTAPAGGTITVSVPASAAQDAAGNPNAESTSVDGTVTYQPPVTGSPAPAPTAVDDGYSLTQDGVLDVAAPGVLGNDSASATLSAQVVTGPGNGTLALSTDGGFTYTPDEGFVGTDTFTYRATAAGRSSQAEVTITVTATPTTPVVVVDRGDDGDGIDSAIAWSRLTSPEVTTRAAGGTVLLARDDLFADSLSSGGAQGLLDAPLLLTAGDVLDTRTRTELERLQPREVIILGGTAAVSDAVAEQVAAEGYEVSRVEGSTRLSTASALARRIAPETDSAVLARAFGSADAPDQAFADALAAGALAAQLQHPLLLTEGEALSSTTADYLVEAGVERVLVIGGTAAITETVLEDLAALGIEVDRVAGATRFETAVAIAAERGAPSAADADGTVLVDGGSPVAWTDAFPAALFAGRSLSPVVLADVDTLPVPTAGWLAGGGTPLYCGTSVTTTACEQAAVSLAG